MKQYLIAVVTSLLIITGCATITDLSGNSTVKKIQLGADLVLLDREFSNAYVAILQVPFTPSEKLVVDAALGRLQQLRDVATRMIAGKADGQEVLLVASNAKQYLDELGFNYNTIFTTYRGYLERNRLSPDPQLVAYHSSAVQVFMFVSRELATKNVLDMRAAGGLLEYVARIFTLYSSGGASLLIPQAAPPERPKKGEYSI